MNRFRLFSGRSLVLAAHLLRALLGVVWLILACPSLAQACGMADASNSTAEDYIASEQAVIFWDEAQHVEHFIRQAEIRTSDKDIGFIVPTPHVPELVEADARLFQLAAEVARPRKVREIDSATPLQIFGPVLGGPAAVIMKLSFFSLLTGMSDAREDGVKIISEQDVAGYHAAILSANDGPALARWLKQNGYGWTPQLEAWLQPYVAAQWTITAFKLTKATAPGAGWRQEDRPIVTRAIRMSFATDRPFYPYSEPGTKDRAHAASPYGRALRVAVLSSHRMQGALEEGLRWPGELFFAGSPMPEKGSAWKSGDWLEFAKLEGQLTLPETLTYWRDLSNPRPGKTDLFFSPSEDSTPFHKTEIDPSLMALHLIDLTDIFADLAGFLIAILLPAAPLYCGWRLLKSTWRAGVPVDAPSQKPRFRWNRILGFCAILSGILYSLSCLAAAYLLTYANDLLPGKPMPWFCSTFFCSLLALLMATMVYTGIQAWRNTRLPGTPWPRRFLFIRGWNYLMATGSLLVGVGFTLAVLGVLLAHFMGISHHHEEDDIVTLYIADYLYEGN